MNITAVAKRAGVSTATVSRVMNGSANVSPGTAERVREAVGALNFYPNTNARALGSGRSGLYGLIISDITNPYFPELVKAFEDIAVEHGQDVLIANTNYDPKRTETCVIRMLQRKVDGVAIMASELEEHLIETFGQRQIPTIFMDAVTSVRSASTVSVDYSGGVAQAMQYLFQLGHRDIAFISGPLMLDSARARAEAFQVALRERGITIRRDWLQEGDHRVEGGHHAMMRILNSGPVPTAIVGSNDLTAIGAMGAIRERGLAIPNDISVVGFDDIELSAYTVPALTTLHVPRRELASTAFRALFRGRETPDNGRRRHRHVIKTKLVVRQSTGEARVKSTSLARSAKPV